MEGLTRYLALIAEASRPGGLEPASLTRCKVRSMRPKVFCVGFHKTGTKTLAAALRLLGYRVTGPNWTKEVDIATTASSRAMALVDQFDAFQDNPWPLLYRELDTRCPESKFILTTRDADRWITSVSRY